MKMLNSKFIVSAFLVAQIFAMSPDVLAQAKKPAQISSIQTLGLANVAPVQPGQYSFNMISEKREKLYKELRLLDQQNKTTIEAAVKEVEKAYTALITESYSVGLRKIAEDSITKSVSIDTYLTAKRNFDQTIVILNSKISMLNSLQDSTAKMQTSQGEISLSPSVRANLKKISDSFTEQRNTFISEMNKLTVNVHSTKFGGDIEQKVSEVLAEELRRDKFNAASAQELRNKAMLKMTAGEVQKRQTNAYTQFLFKNIQTVVNTYGKEQVYRFETDGDGLKQALENLNNMMMVRSYLRVKYGTPLGTIAVQYKKEKLNFDLVSFKNELSFYQINGLDSNAENLRIETRNKLKNALMNSTLKSASFLQEGSGFAAQILSALTTVRGEHAWAYVNTAVLNVLLQDLEEEMMLSDPMQDGTLLVRDHFKARFSKTDKDKAFVKSAVERFDKIIEGKAIVNANSGDANSVLMQQGTALKSLRDFRSEGAVMLKLAEQMEGDSDSRAEEDARVKGLFE
ncbi:MAG: hypothetical protein K2Q18_11915 [Bdellovibrionales bacterium]|nr:hypothetical protein [Bdellovibrionales bacterium]